MPRHASPLIAALCTALAASQAAWSARSEDLGLVINQDDPYSVRVGAEYARLRSIPDSRIVRLRLPVSSADLSPEDLQAARATVEARLPRSVQFLALAWTRPFRVDCLSITMAFAIGYDPRFCASGCQPTPRSPYFASESRRPFDDFGFRPAMLLAAAGPADGVAMIRRGVAADATRPSGTVYLLDTRDTARNIRAASYARVRVPSDAGVRVQIVQGDELRDRPDVLVYLTGLVRVPAMTTNHFLPGAIADHVTSNGGVLVDSPQMSALEWIAAGATGSYGTVVEPCAFPEKFPDAPTLVDRYLRGESLVEAYWKSVRMPSQGVFIGEPLAAPFRRP